jgi:hypothetical protein
MRRAVIALLVDSLVSVVTFAGAQSRTPVSVARLELSEGTAAHRRAVNGFLPMDERFKMVDTSMKRHRHRPDALKAYERAPYVRILQTWHS